jgi:hypothetical protein
MGRHGSMSNIMNCKPNKLHHSANWAGAVLVSIALALHSKPKPHQPSFACARRYAGARMDRDQLHAMSLKISDLQVALDVFEGMFISQKNSDQIVIPFPEIGRAISAALITELVIGCAAIFSDPPRSMGNENMSIENLRLKYLSVESPATKLIYEQLTTILKAMNIKDFRNKYVGHFDLNNVLGISFVVVNKNRTKN